jgi:hypothetical protein
VIQLKKGILFVDFIEALLVLHKTVTMLPGKNPKYTLFI